MFVKARIAHYEGAQNATPAQIAALGEFGFSPTSLTQTRKTKAVVDGVETETETEVPYVDWGYKSSFVDLRKFVKVAPLSWLKIEEEIVPSLGLQLIEAIDRIEEIVLKQSSGPTQFNEKVSVVVPDLGLLMLDEVDVAYNHCTTDLQDRLEEGWRILAVCPQPDQRRPDYILGRKKQK